MGRGKGKWGRGEGIFFSKNNLNLLISFFSLSDKTFPGSSWFSRLSLPLIRSHEKESEEKKGEKEERANRRTWGRLLREGERGEKRGDGGWDDKNSRKLWLKSIYLTRKSDRFLTHKNITQIDTAAQKVETKSQTKIFNLSSKSSSLQ